MPGHTRNNPAGSPRRTYTFRPLPGEVAGEVDRSLGGSFFNFGLYFNKWLKVTETGEEGKGFRLFEYRFQVKPKVSRSDDLQSYQFTELLQNYEKLRDRLAEVLKRRHEYVESAYRALERLNYLRKSFSVELKRPLIIGLGNAHPTERGFTFHWTMGIPYIPAEAIKGVVRLAYLVERAREDASFFEHWAEEDDLYVEAVKNLFGCAEGMEEGGKRGSVIFFDALPAEVPQLTAEITTCHYPDYYGGRKGPTEDQNPNPLPFLAVAPGIKFRFTMLLSGELSEKERDKLEGAFKAAIRENGFGAKTSLGHGRFELP